jgi:hypothetical protein
MRRYLLIVLTIIGILFVAMANQAQSRWSLWVYQAETGQLLRVDNNGSVTGSLMLSMPLSAARSDSTPLQSPVIAPAGDKIAYLANPEQIVIQDLGSGQVLGEIGMSEIGLPHNRDDRLILGDVAFSTDSQQVVYSEYLGGFGWQIQVYDIASQSILATLRSNSEVVRNFPAIHGGIRPKIISIQGDRISFSADIRQPVGIHSYHWFYLGNILSETVAAPNFQAVSFPYSGEIVLPLWDWRSQANNPDFRYDYQQSNSLHAYRQLEGRFPLVFSPDLNIERVWFIQGGERLLLQAYEDEIHSYWLIIGRDGQELRRLPVAGSDVTGTPDGFVYTTPVGEQTAVVLVNTKTLANAGETLWVQPNHWRILWAGVNQAETALSSFVALGAAYQDPSGVPNPLATPTLAPGYNPFRYVGMEIQVWVPEEGFLNLRDTPSTSGNVLTLLESGTRGHILSGPVEADGFIWWEIQLSGRSGWVVESLPASLALIPPQNLPTPVTITPTATQGS